MSNPLIKALTNLRTLRSISREMSIEQIEEASIKLNAVLAERKEEAEAEYLEKKEKEDKINSFVELLKSEGIDSETLIQAINGKSRPVKVRAKREPQYEYETDEGIRKTWTGQGRTPSAIQNEINSGNKTLEDFKIK
ncbi:DNA-binding protein StpA [Vibrio chagasii]|nr:DNA-binding protein StpA [Vibrio chagasii]